MRDNIQPVYNRMQLEFAEEKKESSKVSDTTTFAGEMSSSNTRTSASEETTSTPTALQLSAEKESNAKTALAKSDAVILELRSTVRQLKRQLEKVQLEKEALEKSRKSSNDSVMSATDARVGELQTELDKYHAQLLTADMVRKELEDTLEAEQYTWELKLQDQERTIQQLEQDCANLVDDLDQCRKQWKEDEDAWTNDVEELRMKLDQAQQEARHWKGVKSNNKGTEDLQKRIVELEQERRDLQSCLDEALKELEAVDAELQGDDAAMLKEENIRLKQQLDENSKELTEQLQHLYRWLLEKDGFEASLYKPPSGFRETLHAIQTHIENLPSNDSDLQATRKQVSELEAQLSTYKGDLQAREESSAELRASLKEAVDVLNPLQELLAKTEEEKELLEKEVEHLKSGSSLNSTEPLKIALADKDDEINNLKAEIQSLEMELSRAKVMAASQFVAPKTVELESEELLKARKEIKAKRIAESNLQNMLNSTRAQFQRLQEHNSEVEAKNSELKLLLERSDESRLLTSPNARLQSEEAKRFQIEIERRDDALRSMEHEIQRLHNDLSAKQDELRSVRTEVDQYSVASNSRSQSHMQKLDMKLKAAKKELQQRKDAEKALNASLKEALDLLRPLQSHLEEAEREKQELERELIELQGKVGTAVGPSNSMKSSGTDQDGKLLNDLQETVRRLEKENSQLHNALEDLSQNFNTSHLSGLSNLSHKEEMKLREDVVATKSRYEVTQRRLEEALGDSKKMKLELKKKNDSEKALLEEVEALRSRLKQSDIELKRNRSGNNADIVAKNTAANASTRVPQTRSRVPYQLV